jgi:hypothetical protein
LFGREPPSPPGFQQLSHRIQTIDAEQDTNLAIATLMDPDAGEGHQSATDRRPGRESRESLPPVDADGAEAARNPP